MLPCPQPPVQGSRGRGRALRAGKALKEASSCLWARLLPMAGGRGWGALRKPCNKLQALTSSLQGPKDWWPKKTAA